jgi:hypothetical protein
MRILVGLFLVAALAYISWAAVSTLGKVRRGEPMAEDPSEGMIPPVPGPGSVPPDVL